MNTMLYKTSFWVILFCVSSLLFSSCKAYQKLPYVVGAETIDQELLNTSAFVYEAKIMPNDILSITVTAETPGIVDVFNQPAVSVNAKQSAQPLTVTSGSSSLVLQNYIVDKGGNINFPVIGSISVGGLTRAELENKVMNLIYPKYVTEKPLVNVRFFNYKVTVLGEVAKPGIYSSENNVMTIFDALALAGDLTIYGKRSNVTLLRENEKGELIVRHINLQDKNILLQKDVYYLQQNDKIIVEANKARGNASSISSTESLGFTLGLSLISIVIAVITLTK